MSQVDALSTLAEIAIAIAGFSGIVSVFGRRSLGEWSPDERSRLIGLLHQSFAALFFCIVPFALLAVPVSEPACWRILSLAFASYRVFSVAFSARIALQTRPITQDARESIPAIAWAFVVGDSLAVLVLLANAVAWAALWPYLAAIIWGLCVASVLFVRLIMVPVLRTPAA